MIDTEQDAKNKLKKRGGPNNQAAGVVTRAIQLGAKGEQGKTYWCINLHIA